MAGWARFLKSSRLHVPSVGGEQTAVVTGALLGQLRLSASGRGGCERRWLQVGCRGVVLRARCCGRRRSRLDASGGDRLVLTSWRYSKLVRWAAQETQRSRLGTSGGGCGRQTRWKRLAAAALAPLGRQRSTRSSRWRAGSQKRRSRHRQESRTTGKKKTKEESGAELALQASPCSLQKSQKQMARAVLQLTTFLC